MLDLIFVNNVNLINDHSIICNERLSDHYIIKFNLNYDDGQKRKAHKSKQNHYRTNLHQYDFHGASDELWFRFNLLV